MNASVNSSPMSSKVLDGQTETVLDPRTTAANAIISVLLLLIALTALVGNTLVIAAVFQSSRLWNEIANLFIVNLCITDLSSASIVMTSSAVAVAHDRWVMGGVWCSIVCGSNYVFIIVSMLTLCIISLDRYLAIQHSLRYNTFVTKARVLILIVYTWVQGFIFGLVPMVYNWIDYDYWEATCAIQWYLYGNPVLTYVIVAFILCFLLPGVLLFIAYCKIFTTAKRILRRPHPAIEMISAHDTHSSTSNQSHTPRPHQSQPAHNNNSQSKVLRSLLIMVLAFFICMTPFSMTKLYKVIYPEPDALPGYASMIATFFQFMSSAVNPFIYGLFREDFQKAFLYIFRRLFRRKIPGSNTIISVT